jgi:glycosyltransferase involved in cell wall biosynthesis
MAGPVSIAFVSSLPRWGGGEKWMLHAARAMAERGHTVCLIGQPGGEITRRAAASGLRVRPLKMTGILVPWTLAALRAILVRERVTVACVNQDREVHLTALATVGLPGFRLVPRRGSPDPIKGKPFYRYSYARRVDRLIVNCAALGDKVCVRAPWFDRAKLRVVYNGIDADAFAATARRGRVRAELGLAADRLVVSLVGEVGWRKGQAVLLEAVAQLRADGAARDAVFLIAGEGSGRAELEARARALGLSDGAVRCLGFRNDVPDLLADTDLLVLPSFWEGFPNSLIEGMALGLPVVSTPVDGIPELVVDGVTGVLTPPGDAPALAAAIGSLLGDAGRRRALGEAGRARVRAEFADTKMMDLVENCLTAWGHGGR